MPAPARERDVEADARTEVLNPCCLQWSCGTFHQNSTVTGTQLHFPYRQKGEQTLLQLGKLLCKTIAATRYWIPEAEITISWTTPRRDTWFSKCLPHNEENAVLPLQLLLPSPSWHSNVLLSVPPFKCHPFAGKHHLGVPWYTPQETPNPCSQSSGLS